VDKDQVRASKFLSLVLRHRPEAIGISLDEAGWTPVAELLSAAARHGQPLTRALLERVVADNDKRRFAFSDDGKHIRAHQGQRVPVRLELEALAQPDRLYHGTVARFLPSIRKQGLLRRKRHHVHLSPDRKTATAVGGRRGKAVILVVDAAALHRDGSLFFRSENGVWLTDAVPPAYIVEGL
jgi:putative RNA 2'-phosphotransferase